MRGAMGGRSVWREAGAVAALALVGIALRTYRLDLGWFGVDQARDIATALDIVGGRDFPTIGPTMRRVTRLGALYYYFWSLPYLMSRDPIAGYWFAALLSCAALVLTWYVARRLWGVVPAVVTLAVAMAHPVWIIDGRIAWAPAALPAATIALLWLVLDGRRRPALAPTRAAMLGALLGLAVQLHLAMAVWVAATAVVLALDRPGVRVWLAWAASFLVAASPAIWAVVAMPATEAGVATLVAENAAASVGARLSAIVALPLRVPAAFSQWTTPPPFPPALAAITTGALIVAVSLGLVRLVITARARERAVRLMAIAAVATIGLVAVVPGAPWYYYLDALLPVWALGAGSLFAAFPGPRERGDSARARLRGLAAAVVVLASLGVAARMATWLGWLARHQYVAVDPALLSLEPRPGRDAAVPGRLLPVAVKREVAERLTRAWSDPPPRPDDASGDDDAARERRFADLWHRLHGPAWEDATGDNGFWVRAALRDRGGHLDASAARHFALWYRDDAVARELEAASPSAVARQAVVGPLLLATSDSAIVYERCRGDGSPATVPMRAVPHPKRYGDGTSPKPASLPARIQCVLGPRSRDTRVVASLSGPGAVEIIAGERLHGGDSTSAICVPAGPERSFDVAVSVPDDGAAALDVYDLPAGVGCAP